LRESLLPSNWSLVVVGVLMVSVAGSLGACDDEPGTSGSETPRASREPSPVREVVPDAVLRCADRVEGAPGLPTLERQEDLVVGRVVFDGLRGEARRARKRPREVADRYASGEGAVKILAGVRARARTTVAVAPSSRAFVGFVYGRSRDPRDPRDSLDESERVVEFQACPMNERRFDGRGRVGRRTWFAGGLLIARAHCLYLLASVRREPARRYKLAFGVPVKRCRDDHPNSGIGRVFLLRQPGRREEDLDSTGGMKVSILDKIMGRGKKAAGDIAGDSDLQQQGRREERKGEEKEKLAEAQERADEKAQDVADLERRT
jgi:uncharacterized protein YjbJ (UPF0337 family)